MTPRLACLALLAGALAACSSVPERPPARTAVLAPEARLAAEARLAERESVVRALPAYGFAGRVAMSNGRDGGNGRLDWRQSGASFSVALTAPVTRQSWRLTGDPDRARIEGLDGGPREDSDVVRLLWEATGFDIPVAALAAWAAGMRAEPARFGEAEVEFTADGQLARLRQNGWTIDYLDWQSDAAGSVPALPVRINAAREAARVRLIVDAWMPDSSDTP
ncbi:lipoprotein insertase outer membrane protein LolB [Luteimonas deserti]|uniref:Outer-membrane lipoprotein LolB n=1 Tax=Luteimonas deserti TaxID=2752306 RepID=A0A7Z0TTD2_9GAMM|nr:lipoprotein insertase outer membrane protein LolB [Luteimonas deserti]NYZ61686.1 outer membrane lipoprotein LolB [Luteimonas deserti]